jgi:hypothetical protein
MSVQGKWELAVTRPEATVQATLDLAVHGSAVTGTSSRSDGLSVAILDGSLAGDRLAYDIELHDPVPARLHFDLNVSGDGETLEGVVTSEQIGDGRVAGKRV